MPLVVRNLFVLYRMETWATSGRSEAFPIIASGQMADAYADLNGGALVEQEVGDAVWRAVPHESGHVYYWNSLTNETSWTWPEACDPVREGTPTTASKPIEVRGLANNPVMTWPSIFQYF